MREKLIELLVRITCNGSGEIGSCPSRKYGFCGEVNKLSYCTIQHIADHLIANGVVISKNETPTTNADRCVCCGAIIPEGRQVCTQCMTKNQDKGCAWCKAEYTIVDDDFGQPVHPTKVKFCFNCGRRLR